MKGVLMSEDSIQKAKSYPILARVSRNGGGCSGGNCPTVYRKDSDHFIIQGAKVDSLPTCLPMPIDECAVEVPVSLIVKLVEDNHVE